jgi:hypothetical protein
LALANVLESVEEICCGIGRGSASSVGIPAALSNPFGTRRRLDGGRALILFLRAGLPTEPNGFDEFVGSRRSAKSTPAHESIGLELAITKHGFDLLRTVRTSASALGF